VTKKKNEFVLIKSAGGKAGPNKRGSIKKNQKNRALEKRSSAPGGETEEWSQAKAGESRKKKTEWGLGGGGIKTKKNLRRNWKI